VGENAEINNAKIRILQGNLFEPVKGEKFDVILLNAPYLPSSDENLTGAIIDKAWGGREDGRTIIDRFIKEVKIHLRDGGKVQLVQSSLSNIEKNNAKN